MAQDDSPKRVATTIDERLHYRFKNLVVQKRDRSLTLVTALDLAFSKWLDRQEKKHGIATPAA